MLKRVRVASEAGSVDTCIDSLAECLELLLASAVGASGISCEAIVEEVLCFELKDILVGWSWGISTPQVELVGDS